jgi:hypothetical protein
MRGPRAQGLRRRKNPVDNGPVKRPPEPKKAGKSGRDRRLGAALRENLRRRKAQARGRDVGPADKSAPPPEKPR